MEPIEKKAAAKVAAMIAPFMPEHQPRFPEGPATVDAVQMPRPEWGADEKQTAVSVGASLAFGGSSPPVGSEPLKPACQELLWNYTTGPTSAPTIPASLTYSMFQRLLDSVPERKYAGIKISVPGRESKLMWIKRPGNCYRVRNWNCDEQRMNVAAGHIGEDFDRTFGGGK